MSWRISLIVTITLDINESGKDRRVRYPFKLRGRPLVTTSIVVAISVLTANVSTFFYAVFEQF